MEDLTPSLALLQGVKECSGFRAFARIVGLRIERGQTLDVFRMLHEIGASPEIAHKVIEGWPTWKTARATIRKLGPLITLEEYAAAWLACYIPSFTDEDWPRLTTRAVRVAAALREEETSPPG